MMILAMVAMVIQLGYGLLLSSLIYVLVTHFGGALYLYPSVSTIGRTIQEEKKPRRITNHRYFFIALLLYPEKEDNPTINVL